MTRSNTTGTITPTTTPVVGRESIVVGLTETGLAMIIVNDELHAIEICMCMHVLVIVIA